MTGRENILKFVQNHGSDGELLRKVYSEAKSRDLCVQMVSATELLKQDLTNDKSLFVVDVFTGECFQSLISQKKRIFGPLCILQCLEKVVPVPNVYHAVYSLAMHNVVVSCTSVSRSMRDKLYQLVERMGGVPAKDFTSAVTHLVAGEVGSKKYAIACSLKKLVVLPSWVEEAWERTQNKDFDAKDINFVNSHLCPIFKGCTVCVTGIASKKRKEIQSLVEKHGGTYSAELKLKATTHLLVENPTGEKYEFAVQWNVHCVHPDWLYSCIEAGYWVEESSYVVRAKRDLDRTRSTGGRLSITTVNATMNSTASTSASKKAAEAALRSAEIHGNTNIFNESRQPTRAESSWKRTSTFGKQTDGDDDLDYNVQIPFGEMFLDGCKIYLTGFTGQKLEKLQKIINAGGATRFNQINASVSHVVMGEKLPKDIDMLTKSEFSPHVVTAKWLIDSCRQIKCLPEEDYYCMETDDDFEEIARPIEESEKAKKQQPSKVTGNVADDNDDVLSQYLDFMKNDMSDITELELDGKMVEDKDETKESHQNNETNVDQHSGNSSQNEESEKPLHGITILIKGFHKEQEVQLQEVIECNGGSVLEDSSRRTASYAVLPMNYECHSCKAKTMVTFCWLERSIEAGKLLEPTSNFLFTPFVLAKDTYPLKDCVISISQYSGVERDHLMQLAEMLGAHYQEYFSRKVKDNFLTNTHLLLQEPMGSKYEAAIRWNVPAVSADWLFECARSGTKLDEASFTVDKGKSEEDQLEEEKTWLAEKNSTLGHVDPGITDNNNTKNQVGLTKFQEPPGDGGMLKAKDHVHKEMSISMPVDAPPIMEKPSKPPAGFGRPKRPSFDLTDAIEVLQSPCCSSGSSSNHSRLSRGSRSSFLLDDYIQEHMQAALKNTGSLPGPTGSEVEMPEQTSIMSKDQSEKENNAAETVMFLHGVILNVSKKLAKQQTELHNMASAVGADCRWSLDGSCTHVLHEGRLTKEQNQAKSKGVHIVSPHWLNVCIEEQRRVDETLYPSTYNPKLTLSVVKTRRSVRDSKEIKSEAKVGRTEVVSVKTGEAVVESWKPEKTTTEADLGSSTAEDNNEEETRKKSEISEVKKPEIESHPFSQDSPQSDSLRTKDEIRQIEGIMQAMKSTRRRSRRLNSSNPANSRSSSGNSSTDGSRKTTRRQSSRLRSLRSGQNNSEDETDEQQVETITYDDPKSRLERERIIAQLTDCSPNPTPESECSEDNDETIDEKQVERSRNDYSTKDNGRKTTPVVKKEELSPSQTPTPAAPPIALQITSTSCKPEPVSLLEPAVELTNIEARQSYKFLLSAMSQQEKIDYGALIEELGGEVYDNQYFNPICSHTIAGQLNRNEKCLASVAAGNWVLHKSYLEASRKAGYFVDEEPHEWGVVISGEPLSSLAIAARRWRMELRKASQQHRTKRGAFQNWKTLLCVESNKLASFTRLLEAGGAEVLGTTPPFNDIIGVTHAFISSGMSAPVDSVDMDHLERSGILVLRTDYIANYLTENPAPCPEKYFFRKSQEPLKVQNRKRKPEDEFSEIIEKRPRRR